MQQFVTLSALLFLNSKVIKYNVYVYIYPGHLCITKCMCICIDKHQAIIIYINKYISTCK